IRVQFQLAGVDRLLLAAPGPSYGQSLYLGRCAEAEEDAWIVGGKIAAASLGEAGQLALIGFEDEGGADDVAVVFADELDAEPAGRVALGGLVAQEDGLVVGVADDDVGPAIVVQIADGNAAGEGGSLEEGSAALGPVLKEAALAPVDIAQQVG